MHETSFNVEIAELHQAIAAFVDQEQCQGDASARQLTGLKDLVDAQLNLGRAYLRQLADETAENPGDDQVRELLAGYTRTVQRAAVLALAHLADGDESGTRCCCEQLQRLNGFASELMRAWPWADAKAIDESWLQYRRGELMGLEEFANELLGAAK